MIVTRGLGRGGQGYVPVFGLGRGFYQQTFILPIPEKLGGPIGPFKHGKDWVDIMKEEYKEQRQEDFELLLCFMLWTLADSDRTLL